MNFLQRIAYAYKKKEPYIKEGSNIIQYDQSGYVLRLCTTRNDEQVWINTMRRDGDLVLSWTNSDGEVIGNIYENPELLQEGN